MRLSVVTPPATLPITLAQARNQLRLEANEASPDDLKITALIGAAVKIVESKIKQTLITTVLDLYIDGFNNPLRILPGPVQSVTSVKYLDKDGNLTTLTTDKYRVSAGKIGWIEPVDSFPTAKSCKDSVVIRYSAGYSSVPDNINAAILLLVDHLYNNSSATTSDNLSEIPLGVDALLSMERVGWLP